VTYAAETPVIDPTDPRAQAIVPDDRGRVEADKSRGDALAALEQAAIKVEAAYDIAREHHNPMEPHATVAAWDGDRLILWSKSQ
jgi:xanthine dehydrogenase YagR molybdenum-binding subunit